MKYTIEEVLNECLESFANLLKTEKGQCLNPLQVECSCTVCKIMSVLTAQKEELPPIGSSETGWAPNSGGKVEVQQIYMVAHEGLNLEKVECKSNNVIRVMETKTIPYGTVKKVVVKDAGKFMIVVDDDNREGYFLLGHGLDPLPEVGERGIITFVQNDRATKGHWEYKKGE